MDKSTRKRPWLAAALAIPVTGLGHVYLRQWQRALGWLLVVAAAFTLFLPSLAVEGPNALAGASVEELAPLILIVATNAVDAYLIACRQNFATEVRSAQRCPYCYREPAAGVGFCEWCATPLVDTGREPESIDRGSSCHSSTPVDKLR